MPRIPVASTLLGGCVMLSVKIKQRKHRVTGCAVLAAFCEKRADILARDVKCGASDDRRLLYVGVRRRRYHIGRDGATAATAAACSSDEKAARRRYSCETGASSEPYAVYCVPSLLCLLNIGVTARWGGGVAGGKCAGCSFIIVFGLL